jgi:hypothetical protein
MAVMLAIETMDLAITKLFRALNPSIFNYVWLIAKVCYIHGL